MTVTLWVLNGLLAAAFLAIGGVKLVRTKQSLIDAGQVWVEDFSQRSLTIIGTAEVLGAAGLLLPLITGVAPVMSPVAATCLTVLMAGAIVVNIRRGESPRPAVVMAVPSVSSAALGFAVVL